VRGCRAERRRVGHLAQLQHAAGFFVAGGLGAAARGLGQGGEAGHFVRMYVRVCWWVGGLVGGCGWTDVCDATLDAM
jgi:hypothetical protein